MRDTATDALARTIATMLQLPGVDADAIWQAVQAEFFPNNERIMTRLKRRVAETRPLFNLTVPRAGSVRVGNVIHMEPRAAAPAAAPEAAPVAARGRRRQAA